jgi:signal transduction histidine kinase
VVVIVAIELNVMVGTGPGAVRLTATAYLFSALLAVPILFRHRWPLRVLIASALLVFLYYIFDRRNISPTPAFAVPVYDAAVAGYLALAIAIPAAFMAIGLVVVQLSTKEGLVTLVTDFGPQITLLALAIMLGEVIRSRQALAAETARRLQLADEERAAEAGRLVAEERLRIARELHDTVAHSMATITVQAGSGLHLIKHIPQNEQASSLQAALTAIRETSKSALTEMRSVLGQLRQSESGASGAGAGSGAGGADGSGSGGAGAGLAPRTGLHRLPALRDAVSAAGTPVTVTVVGEPAALPAETDHAAYRILQESLTNVLRHAGPGAAASVCLRYEPGALALTVTDDGNGTADDAISSNGEAGHGNAAADDAISGNGQAGHGIDGMRERAAAVGGTLTAARQPDGGFQVSALLPTEEPS